MRRFSIYFLRIILLGNLLLVNSQIALSQPQFQYINNISVFENDIELANPFAGGLNSGQYNTIDLDSDGNLDLVIFDRTSDKINTFINTGSAYEYSPEYEHFFPENLENWMVFVDYDCDGKKDIFTYTNFGMRVFRNTTSGNFPSWELVADPLFTLGISSPINLFLNSTDIPGIGDIDGDGDLDILVFNFSTGALIEFHKNFSMERTNNCGALDFERTSQKYGDIEECVCDVFVFGGNPCPSGGRQLHSGGKTTTLFDYDKDGDIDLVIGQEVCNDIYLIENKGSVSSESFDSHTNLFPENSTPVDMFTFPTSFIEDVNFDGLVDFIVAPNLRSNPGNGIDFQNSSWLYENTGTSTNNNFVFDKSNFIQEDMIDVGEFAYPVFADVDGDGDDDLLIGNKGTNHTDGFYSNVLLYRNGPTGFVLADEDYAGLSALMFTDIKPNFQDLNDDGKTDLVFTGRGAGNLELHYLLNTSTGNSLEFNANDLSTYGLTFGGGDNPVFVDMNENGILDLLIGRSTGRLTYFKNSGTNLLPVLESVTDTLMGLNFSSEFSNLSLTIGDVDSDGTQDLITTDRSGILKIYYDFINDQKQTPQSELLSLEGVGFSRTTELGRVSRPALGQSNNLKLIALGSIQGGIRLIGTDGEVSTGEELKVTVFPVPSYPDKKIKLQTDNANVQFEIFGVSGERISALTAMDQFTVLELDLSTLRSGIYLARFQNGTQSKTVKFVL